MFTKAERLISLRNLKPKKKEGFLKIISIFSFLGIMLGVAILIIVMSVMNGFKTNLTQKILGLNPHVVVQPNNFKIDDDFILNLKNNFENINLSKSYSGEGIIISNETAKGVILKGVNKNEKKIIEFFDKFSSKYDVKDFKSNNIYIGSEQKVLDDCDYVESFPPGSYSYFDIEVLNVAPVKYYKPQWELANTQDYEIEDIW